MYVIRNNDTGKYVTPRGSAKSYTGKLEEARTWTDAGAAQRECCGNETVVPVTSIMTRPDNQRG